MQIETTIELHADGSGTITERVNFSRKLLDAAGSAGPSLQLESLLTRKAALARMKHMGKGIQLVSHKVSDGSQASRESVTVYTIPDLADFVYVSPFVPRGDPHEIHGLKTVIWPVLQDNSSLRFFAGWMCVHFRPFTMPKSSTEKKEPIKKAPRSPLASQTLRDLRPIFEDLMEGLEVKVVFRSYAPIKTSLFGWRDAAARTREVELVNFVPGKNMDSYGYPFLENEEIVVDLLRWDPNSPWIMNAVKDWPRNKTLPVLHHGGGIFFAPSRYYFDRWFEGKTLKYYAGGKLRERPALFKEIGWSPKKKPKP
jgi:hypothetical protein